MEMLGNIALLLVGFILLIKGADYFVEGSSSVAKLLKVPSIVIGLTVVAMGTSLPELSVSVSAALNGSNEIAISNVVGSNIFNLIVVLGACALFTKIPVDKQVLRRDYPFLIFITIALVFFTADIIKPWADVAEGSVGILSRLNSIVLLVLFIFYLVYTVKSALRDRKRNRVPETNAREEKPASLLISIIFIVCGVIAIKFGGDFVVDSAKYIALHIGMSETLVGLTIVAVGTSLPELVTSIVAAKKGETSLAVGNVVGSNIFNTVLILGASGAIHPIMVGKQNLIDMVIVLVISILLYFSAVNKRKIERREGIIMLAVYAIYMIYAILR